MSAAGGRTEVMRGERLRRTDRIVGYDEERRSGNHILDAMKSSRSPWRLRHALPRFGTAIIYSGTSVTDPELFKVQVQDTSVSCLAAVGRVQGDEKYRLQKCTVLVS